MGRTAIVTGASSGIGQAVAVALARRGINVVLGARRLALLEGVAATCRQYDVRAVAVETDVTNQDQVDLLAQAAIDEFGGYDIWINNAGVTMVGRFTDMSPEMFRKVVETNFFGYVYGAWAALRQFEAQEHGLLINVSSLFGTVPAPCESPYVASKCAVTALSAALRQEMTLVGQRDIHVCTVLPSSIDTPIYRNAANVSGQSVRPPGPLYPVSKVVEAVLGFLDDPQAEVIVGRSGRTAAWLYRLLPREAFEKLFGRYIELSHFTKEQVPIVPGNIFMPGDYEGVGGNWPRPLFKRKQFYYAAAGIAAGAIAGLALYAYHKKQENDS